MGRVKIAGQIYPLNPSYGSNWGYKITNFVFYLISLLFLLLDLLNVLRCIGKPYVKSQDSRSYLPPDPPLWVKLGS